MVAAAKASSAAEQYHGGIMYLKNESENRRALPSKVLRFLAHRARLARCGHFA